jgi:cytochrome c biogenesis protein CcdA
MTSKGNEERLAILETEHRHHKETLADVVEQLERLNTQVGIINSKIDKNMGFIAGVAFVFSMLGAIFGLFGGAILKKFGGS